MQSVVTLIQFQVVVGLVCCFVLLYMQMRAYNIHKQKFFITLAISSIFAIAATILSAWIYFVPLKPEQAVRLLSYSSPLAILATVLATWGGVQLFRAYDRK